MKSLIILLLLSTGLHAQTFSKISAAHVDLISNGTDVSKAVTIIASPLVASYNLFLPGSNATGFLSNNGSGTLSWAQGSLFMSGAGIAMSTGAGTVYVTPTITNATLQATDATGLSRMWVPKSGTIKNLYVNLSVAPGTSDSRTFTLTKNGVAQTVTCQISGAAITASDLTHSFTVNAGDEISLKIVSVKGGGNLGAGVPQWIMEFDY